MDMKEYISTLPSNHPCLAICYCPYHSGETLVYSTVIGKVGSDKYCVCDDTGSKGSPNALFIPNLEGGISIFVYILKGEWSINASTIKRDIIRDIENNQIFIYEEQNVNFEWTKYIHELKKSFCISSFLFNKTYKKSQNEYKLSEMNMDQSLYL